MELNDALSRVRKLTALANSKIAITGDPLDPEAVNAMAKADAIMLQYAIDEAMLDASAPKEQRSKPGMIIIQTPNVTYAGWLRNLLADHCRCKLRAGLGGAKVYGYESDLRYFELVWTELMLHMTKVLAPTWDPNLSVDDNCYALHEAGLNWLQIARADGWMKDPYTSVNGPKAPWVHKTREASTEGRVGSSYKRAYYRACDARGEEPVKIDANGSRTYQRSAADGYSDRIAQRLREIEGRRQSGSALALRMDDLDEYFREQNPDLFRESTWTPPPPCPRCAANPSGSCRDHPRGRTIKAPPVNRQAYARGVAHANTANLHAHAETGGTKRAVE